MVIVWSYIINNLVVDDDDDDDDDDHEGEYDDGDR